MHRLLVTSLAALALLATGLVAGYAAGTGTVEPPPRIAFLANGRVPADALAAGPIAGRLGAPLYTTEADALVTEAVAGLVAYDPAIVIVLGGPVAIADDVLEELSDATGLPLLSAGDVGTGTEGIVRVAGDTRFGTAQAVNELIQTFNPAFLPVDATAVDADQVDGLEADAFAPADLGLVSTVMEDSLVNVQAGELITLLTSDTTLPDTCGPGRSTTHRLFAQVTSTARAPVLDEDTLVLVEITPAEDDADATFGESDVAMARLDNTTGSSFSDFASLHTSTVLDLADGPQEIHARVRNQGSSRAVLYGARLTLVRVGFTCS